ncbi:hypothetical protein AAVH_17058 [Aphelenchoides avenae]|nr:hypothetical protein AAVH_17058 [Aphelenchus avenae]
MYAFNNFLRVETSKEEKRNLLKDARELQTTSPDRAGNTSVGIYTTTSLEYAPKKEAKSRGFRGIAIVVVGPCKGKIELSISTALPEGLVVLVEVKSASETLYDLKLLEPSVS